MTSSVIAHGEPGTLLELYDSNGTRLMQGVGVLEGEFAPGLYELQAKLGEAIWREIVPLQDAARCSISVPPLDVSGQRLPARPDVPTHQLFEAAEVASRTAPVNAVGAAASGQLLLFVSALEESAAQSMGAELRHISLRRIDGSVVPLTSQMWVDQRSNMCAWASTKLALSPAIYRLRVERKSGGTSSRSSHVHLEQLVPVLAGQQTQVFLSRTTERVASGGLTAIDPQGTRILMTSLGRAFDSASVEVRRAEVARVALQEQVPEVSLALLRVIRPDEELLTTLYCVAALVASDQIARAEVRVEVLRHLNPLQRLATVISDVVVLSAILDRGDSKQLASTPVQVRTPPLLQATWRLLLQHQSALPIVAEGLSERIGDCLYSAGVWLAWDTQGKGRDFESDAIPSREPSFWGAQKQGKHGGVRGWFSRSRFRNSQAPTAEGSDSVERLQMQMSGILATVKPHVTDRGQLFLPDTIVEFRPMRDPVTDMDIAVARALLAIAREGTLQSGAARTVQALAQALSLPSSSVVRVVEHAYRTLSRSHGAR